MNHQKLLRLVIGVTLVMLLVVGCGAPAATPVSEAPAATSTPELPAATPTPEPPTATPTPVPPTATPVPPTSTPVPPTPTPLPDLSNVVLTLEDLPPGFEAMPPAEFGFTKEDLSQDDFTVESLFVFLEAEHFELVMGFTALVPTTLEQAGFDVALRQPDFLLDSVIGGMGTTDILEQKDLADLDDIGDASAGVTVAVDMEGIPMRMDIVAFRRDMVGAFIFVMYIDGDVPIVPIGDVARVFDERIVEALSVTPMPVPPTPTALLGIEAPLRVDETELWVTAVEEVEQVMDMKAETGFRLLEVSVEVTQGSPQDVKDWDVSLRDAAVNIYQPLASGWGVFYGGANAAGWTFSVPDDTTALWLILPGDVSVNLAPLSGAPPTLPTFPPTSTPIPETATPALPTPTLIPSDPTMGGVQGVLVDKDTKQPISNASIILLSITADGGWVFDFQNSPRGQCDDKGAFLINVPPGRYGMLFFEGSSTSSPGGVVNDDAGKELIIKVTAGQITDIGTREVKPE